MNGLVSLHSVKFINLSSGLRPKMVLQISFGLSLWSQRKTQPKSEIADVFGWKLMCVFACLQFMKDVLHIVNCQESLNPRELRAADRGHEDHQVWCEKTWKHVLPTLEYWVLELRQLKVTYFQSCFRN